jgi:transcriptional regulator with XRE-family HTH domain
MKEIKKDIITEKHTLLDILSANLDFMMLQKGGDIKTLSENTGISLTNLHNIRRGLTNPTLTTLEALANYFDLSVAQLLSSYLSKDRPENQYILMSAPIFELEIINRPDLSYLKTEKFLPIAIPRGENLEQRILVQLNNNGMQPLYEKGTYFLINFALPLRDGDLTIIKLGEQITTLRKVFVMGSKITVFHPVLMKEEGLRIEKSEIVLLGVVERIIQNL